MNTDRIHEINIGAQIDRLFDDSSLTHNGSPKAVVLMGGVAAGKTTLRLKDYSQGFVLIDAAELFHHLSNGDETLDFPDALLEPLELIGSLVARRAISERRGIVTEIIGADKAPTIELISSLKSVGYSVDIVGVACDLEESIRRNENRGDNISAYYAEPFQRQWIIDACSQVKIMDVNALSKQFQGASLTKLIEKHVRSSSEDQIVAAIQATYAKFPEKFRPAADSFSLGYAQQHWFGPQMSSKDLSELFLTALKDGKEFAAGQGVLLSDEQAFELFNLAVMRVAHFAHSRPAFRKQIGIKKGWFS